MIKKLIKPVEVEKDYVVPFREALKKQEDAIDDGGDGGSGCSGQRTYADEEIDDISF